MNPNSVDKVVKKTNHIVDGKKVSIFRYFHGEYFACCKILYFVSHSSGAEILRQRHDFYVLKISSITAHKRLKRVIMAEAKLKSL